MMMYGDVGSEPRESNAEGAAHVASTACDDGGLAGERFVLCCHGRYQKVVFRPDRHCHYA